MVSVDGRTNPLTSAGILSHVKPGGKIIKFLCYVFDSPVGNTSEILLLGLRTIVDADIDIRYHMKLSVEGISKMVRFIEHESASSGEHYHIELSNDNIVDAKLSGEETTTELYRETDLYEHYENVALMTEIQLKNIVERLKSDEKETKTDGDETMVKNGVIISKFSFEA
jgi:hypothetical protein